MVNYLSSIEIKKPRCCRPWSQWILKHWAASHHGFTFAQLRWQLINSSIGVVSHLNMSWLYRKRSGQLPLRLRIYIYIHIHTWYIHSHDCRAFKTPITSPRHELYNNRCRTTKTDAEQVHKFPTIVLFFLTNIYQNSRGYYKLVP